MGNCVQAASSPCVLKIWYLKEFRREKNVVASTTSNPFELRVHLILKQEIDFILDTGEDNHYAELKSASQDTEKLQVAQVQETPRLQLWEAAFWEGTLAVGGTF